MTESIDKKSLIKVRPADEGDLNFIYSTWLKGLRYGNEWFKLIDQDAYFQAYHQIIERVLNRPTTVVLVACLVEDPSVIIGYSVLDNQTVHWVFVKRPWRKIGICRDLLPTNLTVATHISDVGAALLKKSPNVRFNPFAI